MPHYVKIKSINKITHDVIQVLVEKPDNYPFVPGQATDVSINQEGWVEEKRQITFTSLPGDDHLEFTIKTYPSRKGVTNQLLQLKKDDELILHDVFGEISYKGEGVFIAGGAGVTPFLAILRHLKARNQIGNNKLIFANKTRADIIHEAEFRKLLGDNFINILSGEKVEGYANGYITEKFIKENIPSNSGYFYVCGPPPLMDIVEEILIGLRVKEEFIVKEGF